MNYVQKLTFSHTQNNFTFEFEFHTNSVLPQIERNNFFKKILNSVRLFHPVLLVVAGSYAGQAGL